MNMRDDEKQFNAAVKQGLNAFEAHVRDQSARRQARVLARLQEEMIRLRPHKNRLLFGCR